MQCRANRLRYRPMKSCYSERSPARCCCSPGFWGRGTQFEGTAFVLRRRNQLQIPRRRELCASLGMTAPWNWRDRAKQFHPAPRHPERPTGEKDARVGLAHTIYLRRGGLLQKACATGFAKSRGCRRARELRPWRIPRGTLRNCFQLIRPSSGTIAKCSLPGWAAQILPSRLLLVL